MYGYLNTGGPHGRTSLRHQQCSLCHVYAGEYRQRTRMLAGYDPSALLMVIDGLRPSPAPRVQVSCPLPPFRARRAIDPDWEPAQRVAAVQLFLAGEKLFDDRLDKDSALSSVLERLLRSDIEHAEARLIAWGLDVADVRDGLRAQLRVEEDRAADLDTLSQPTADAMARLVVFCAEDAACDGLDALKAFARSLGRCIYLVDALCDVRRDLHSGAFNPILHTTGHHMSPARLSYVISAIEARLNGLRASFEALPLSRHREPLERVVVSSLTEKARAAMMDFPAPTPVLRMAGVTP